MVVPRPTALLRAIGRGTAVFEVVVPDHSESSALSDAGPSFSLGVGPMPPLSSLPPGGAARPVGGRSLGLPVSLRIMACLSVCPRISSLLKKKKRSRLLGADCRGSLVRLVVVVRYEPRRLAVAQVAPRRCMPMTSVRAAIFDRDFGLLP